MALLYQTIVASESIRYAICIISVIEIDFSKLAEITKYNCASMICIGQHLALVNTVTTIKQPYFSHSAWWRGGQ